MGVRYGAPDVTALSIRKISNTILSISTLSHVKHKRLN